MKRSTKQLGVIDIAKFIFAIGVVAIHAGCLNDNSTTSWLIMHAFLRLAVPFFFCVSGYFFYKSLQKEKDIKSTTKKYIKRLLTPFIFWMILNLPFVIAKLNKSGLEAPEIALKLITEVIFHPWGALWYISALIVAILILAPFYKYNRLKQALVIGLILYLISLPFNTYYFIIENSSFKNLVDGTLNLIETMRNGIFEGLFFVSLGMCISKIQPKLTFSKKHYWLFFIISYILLILEILITKNHSHADDHSLFISFIATIPSLVLLLSRYSINTDTTRIRNLSTGIYFSHILTISTLQFLLKKFAPNPELTTILASVIIIITLSILYNINNKHINKLIS